MSINISDAQVELWIRNGIETGIKSMLSDRYGVGASLKKAIEDALLQAQKDVTECVKQSVLKASVSPEFLQATEKVIASSMVEAYQGAFRAVIIAGAKQAANTDIVAQRVIELTKLAAGEKECPVTK